MGGNFPRKLLLQVPMLGVDPEHVPGRIGKHGGKQLNLLSHLDAQVLDLELEGLLLLLDLVLVHLLHLLPLVVRLLALSLVHEGVVLLRRVVVVVSICTGLLLDNTVQELNSVDQLFIYHLQLVVLCD